MTTLPFLLRADLSQRAVVPPPGAEDWLRSPENGVERYLLDRVGDEVARATSVVRYAPGAKFAAHSHGGGEEIFVLDGVFSDETGDWPAGSYLRNPPGSRHTPFSQAGCLLFVKLWQFTEGDDESVRINTRDARWYPGLVPGLRVQPLHEHAGVSTALVRWEPDTQFNTHAHPGGEEIFVLDGLFQDEHGVYPVHTWLRSPRWSQHTPFTGPQGALILVKVGLIDAPLVPFPESASAQFSPSSTAALA